MHTPLWQSIPVQHVLGPVPVHDSPTAPQVAPAVHTPAWQSDPQQSALAAQVCPSGRHAQVPPEHVIRPQQSVDVVQVPPSSEQHRIDVGDGRHELRAVQHSVAIEQLPPDTAHPGSVQVPPTHDSPAAHVFPHAPQFASSADRSASPVQGPSVQIPPALHVRTRVPQVPHATLSVDPGAHEVHGPSAYVQASEQVRTRDWPVGHPLVEVVVDPGAHSPSPPQAPVPTQLHVVSQRAS